MIITKNEYKSFKSKYELLGKLEQERKKNEALSLDFLDNILNLVNNTKRKSEIKSDLNAIIKIRKTLNQLSENAFN
jgi:hypothetical protein